MPDTYYFHHIPKTAGSTVHDFLNQRFPHESICPAVLWDELIRLPPERLGSYRMFRGHFLCYLESYIRKSLITFTVLRDPVQRTISHYNHVRRTQTHPFYAQARPMSLYDFCLSPETRHMVENFQASYLTSLDFAPWTLAKNFTLEELNRSQLQITLERVVSDLSSPHFLFQKAQRTLAGFAAVGVTEQLQRSLHLFSRIMNCEPPCGAPPQLNASSASERCAEVDDRTLQAILGMTVVDQKLYSYAANRLANDLQQLEVGRCQTG